MDSSIRQPLDGQSSYINTNQSEVNKQKATKVESSIVNTVGSVPTEILNRTQDAGSKEVSLKGFAPYHPEDSQIAKEIIISPKLSKLSDEQKQKVLDDCVKSYTDSVAEFENVIGNLAAKHPDAKEFAHEMLKRINAVAETYHEILIEDNPNTGVSPEEIFKDSINKLPDNEYFIPEVEDQIAERKDILMQEFKEMKGNDKINATKIEDSPKLKILPKKMFQTSLAKVKSLSEEYKPEAPSEEIAAKKRSLAKETKVRFGTVKESYHPYQDGTGTGNVGKFPMTIEAAIKKGELREQMMLIYSSLWGAFSDILDNPTMITRINEKLISNNAGFQINAGEVDRRKNLFKDATRSSDRLLTYAEPLREFRNTGGRLTENNPNKEQNPMAKDIPDLTIREYRATIDPNISQKEFDAMKQGKPEGKEWGERRVQWVRGRDIFRVNPESSFYKKAVAYGKLPVVTGPSGTADCYLNGANYLNMQDYKQKGVLALIGWMVRSGDHSFHEIKEAGTWHGLDYTPGPEVFENVYPDDAQFQTTIVATLDSKNKKLPGEYLKESNQLDVAKKLGFVG